MIIMKQKLNKLQLLTMAVELMNKVQKREMEIDEKDINIYTKILDIVRRLNNEIQIVGITPENYIKVERLIDEILLKIENIVFYKLGG